MKARLSMHQPGHSGILDTESLVYANQMRFKPGQTRHRLPCGHQLWRRLGLAMLPSDAHPASIAQVPLVIQLDY
jgi:hypothetical protein